MKSMLFTAVTLRHFLTGCGLSSSLVAFACSFIVSDYYGAFRAGFLAMMQRMEERLGRGKLLMLIRARCLLQIFTWCMLCCFDLWHGVLIAQGCCAIQERCNCF